MDIFWYLLGDLFRLIFFVVPFFGLFINKLFIAVGFVAFFLWCAYMNKHQVTEKFD